MTYTEAMSKNNLKLAKTICWTIAAISWGFLAQSSDKNMPLTVIIVVLIVAGIFFNHFEDRK